MRAKRTKRDLSKACTLASSVVVLLLAGCQSDSDDPSGEQGMSQQGLTCLGGNECKGMSECAGGPGMNSCEGMNECKGMGWTYTETAEECTDKGGTVKEDA